MNNSVSITIFNFTMIKYAVQDFPAIFITQVWQLSRLAPGFATRFRARLRFARLCLCSNVSLLAGYAKSWLHFRLTIGPFFWTLCGMNSLQSATKVLRHFPFSESLSNFYIAAVPSLHCWWHMFAELRPKWKLQHWKGELGNWSTT